MFTPILRYELHYWFTKPTTYLYAAILFLLALLGMAGTAGAFDGPAVDGGPVNFVNSPLGIYQMFSYFHKLVLLLLPTIFGVSIYRDHSSGMHSILYTYPFTKRDYLLAKFGSSLLVVLLIVAMIGFGAILGTQWPGVHESKIGPFQPLAYVQVYLVYLIPNIICFGTLVFVVVVWTRNIYASFVVVVLLLIFEAVIGQLLGGLERQRFAALFDPLGNRAAFYYTRYWTLAEQNEQLLPVKGLIIYNRLLWLGVASFLFSWTYRRFSFSQTITNRRRWPFSPKRKPSQFRVVYKQLPLTWKNTEQSRFDFSLRQQLITTWHLSVADFRHIVKSWPFICILLGGLLFVVFALLQMNMPYENRVLPVTWVMLDFPVLFFSLVINLLTFLYAGMLVHRAKAAGMDQLMDVMPVPNWVLFLSKFLTLLKMQVVLLSLLLLGGVAVQTYRGYYHYEIGHYLFELYGIHLIGHLIWACAALLVQTILTNPYPGLFLLLLGWMGIGYLPELGITHYIFRFNESPGFDYSDLNGYGSDLQSYFLYKGYWTLFGIALLLMALLFWKRGLPGSFYERLLIAKRRFRGRTAWAMSLVVFCFLVIGSSIYYYDRTDNQAVFSKKEEREWLDLYQKRYQSFADKAQPRISAIKVKLDVYPASNRFKAKGSYLLVNRSDQRIDTILIRKSFWEKTHYQFDRTARHFLPLRHQAFNGERGEAGEKGEQIIARVANSDSTTKCDVLVLEQGLTPGDSLTLVFEIESPPNTLLSNNSKVLNNGTFLWNNIFPRIGYQRLDDQGALPLPSDSTALTNSYAAHDADWIDFEAIVSTSDDQIAIAPGYLQEEWTEQDRHYFHYKMDSPIKFVFGFNSGRYQVMQDQWKDVGLEIYYHEAHAHNLDRMMNGLKASLAYCSENFGPYQHRQARIIEFPVTEGTYATTFANSFPFSEIRFIADVTEDNIDLPFYISAHEMAHQWWGNQVLPADVAGAKMLTESLAEYVALKVLEQEYGKEKMRQFLKYDLDIYLSGRSRSSEPEQPLMYNQGQHYIAYGKGALAFYALSEHLGEAKLNQVLQDYVEKVRFHGPPYTTSIELVNALKRATPDSLQYLLTDWFEKITFYENQVVHAAAAPLENGRYEVSLKLKAAKNYADAAGQPITPQPKLNDYLDIGIYGKDGRTLLVHKQKVTKNEHSITLLVPGKPWVVHLDPYHKLVERNIGDNRLQITAD